MGSSKKQIAATSKSGFVVGSKRFAKISAVEGIRLKPEMTKRAHEASRDALSPEARRAKIIESHSKR